MIETALVLVLDRGVPRDSATLLRKCGYECIHVAEVGMAHAPDSEIVAWAAAQRSVVITLDADFHTILALSGAAEPSVIRLRRQGLGAQAPAESSEGSRGIRGRFDKRGSRDGQGE